MGKWTFVFFGYTNCPDICPTTLAALNQVYERVAGTPDAKNTQTLFISVDPERDTPKVLADYVAYFNPEFLGATGAPDEIETLADKMSAYYDVPVQGEGSLIKHSGNVLLIDPDSCLRAQYSPPFDPVMMASEYHRIRHIPGYPRMAMPDPTTAP